MPDLEDDLIDQIQVLNRIVWEGRVNATDIEEWLKGFGADCSPKTKKRLHALYLLSRFLYFGRLQVRELLKALFRDHFRYPIVAAVRRQAADTRDQGILDAAFQLALSRTRFLGVGNPSESGTHLLYDYRQENGLPRQAFINTHEVFDLQQATPVLANTSVTRYVFIDDFCGSGEQACRYSQQVLSRMRAAAASAGVALRIEYHVLIGTQKGLQRVRTTSGFNAVACVLELDDTFRAFSRTSRYFRSPPKDVDQTYAESFAALFGSLLQPDAPLGFADGQLLLGFSHNTPDNTLPIFWHAGHATKPWNPVFRRYRKT